MTKIHFLTFKINNNNKKSLKMNKVALKIPRMITILRAPLDRLFTKVRFKNERF